MQEHVINGDVVTAYKRLTRKLMRDGQTIALARLKEPSRGQRRRNKHQHHLRQVAKGKRPY